MLRDKSGSIAVEFALVAPIMIGTMMAGIWLAQAFSVNAAATATSTAAAAAWRALGQDAAQSVVAANTASLFSGAASVNATYTTNPDGTFTVQIKVSTPALVPWGGATISASVSASD
jgi:Flp pilus assembly protein TadG